MTILRSSNAQSQLGRPVLSGKASTLPLQDDGDKPICKLENTLQAAYKAPYPTTAMHFANYTLNHKYPT